MLQRYTVFLNDKAVIIVGDIGKTEIQANDITIYYTDKQSLAAGYKHFYNDQDCKRLWIIANADFGKVCMEFNNFFKKIEAAGGIVRNADQEYLFIKRLGVWDLPKGKLHKNEFIQECALREVREETGLQGLAITQQLPSTFHIYTDRHGHEVLKETYWFEMMCHQSQTLVPQTEEDIAEVKWFSAADLGIPMGNTYASLRHLWKQYTEA